MGRRNIPRDNLDIGKYVDFAGINDALEMAEMEDAYNEANARGEIVPELVAETDPYFWSIKAKRGHQVGTDDGVYEIVEENDRSPSAALNDLLFGYDKDGYESDISAPETALMFTRIGLPMIAGRTAYDLYKGNRQPGILDAVFGLGGVGTALRSGRKAGRFARNLDYSMKARGINTPGQFARELYREARGLKNVVRPSGRFRAIEPIDEPEFYPYEIVK